ncbi:pyruvate, orthophosphate dikinase [Halolactibacillus halophilus]|uniref:Pyruvate, phosphate dikinase n=1 Tax=Halolactibacillus halophilus TaxID=306540 RepID=A0A1I5P5I6_9BACI|nr:pyruvate, phosphate dikinase [Halolactibacillus halophilus]GEM01708.1 pyruvate, phosphate dikinase [Halolactibacillus halophilus]SFP29352.1 pyruvate, orthophosphate dikinase [Halolactibacillus halophilus]
MTEKYIYNFNEGKKEMKELLGGKGANLAEMTKISLPVPPGFTLTTESCNRFLKEDKLIWSSLKEEIKHHLIKLEQMTEKKFSDVENPLLLSVRSGAAQSMPGMMDTILNLGLNDQSVIGLSKITANGRFAYDSYRRFIQMFSDVVMEIPKTYFESELEKVKKANNIDSDQDINEKMFKEIIRKYKKIYLQETGETFPQNPMKQLLLAIKAVFLSWNNPRAIFYRRMHNISDLNGTAVNIQSMVFGNRGNSSGTGVTFTRNPGNGDHYLFGEFLLNAQGEDVVAGVRTPSDISELKKLMPAVYQQLKLAAKKLEHHYADMQDIEFTIENNKLFLLQTRNGKRTAHAAITIAMDLYHEGKITKEDALLRIDPQQLEQLLHQSFDEVALIQAKKLAEGLAASPGAASGRIYFTNEAIEAAYEKGVKTILVRHETSPEDISGMVKSEGILTTRGGMTSHAAVVARGMGKCCIAGCSDLKINEDKKEANFNGVILHEGDIISLDGTTGTVYIGDIEKRTPSSSKEYKELMNWIDEMKTMAVRANADTPEDAKQALEFGAEGIGLVRTEHMFFKENRISSVRRMILSASAEERAKALNEILPMQKIDFYQIYHAMGVFPVTIRLLDPPLHEFMPIKKEDIRHLSKTMALSEGELNGRINELHEVNPMLGHRGVRLGIAYPEISRMQVRAIMEAAIEYKSDTKLEIQPEIMIPLVSDVKEFIYIKAEIEDEIKKIFSEQDTIIPYHIGTMIEVPRAALTADKIADEADFFSFGTNDLTQMGYGFSRDDAGGFISEYIDKNIFEKSPFDTIDQEGIGQLVKTAIQKGRKVKPTIKMGVCGEHGGDPTSINFFQKMNLEYISCSPFRVPIARLAAAQAAIKNR